ncbi:EF-hand domain-containing protein [Paraglaciecola sp.]|uniref:EF-hand domain-containing protein n=1 Tax=Paraglaciecola sp. TaxID=1920173 RepID=UPI0030F45DB8
MVKVYCHKSFIIFSLFFIPLFFVCSVWADEEKIKQLDLDQDGKIAIKEAVADPELLASFGKIDTDGDGLITRLELERAAYGQQVKVLTKTN